MTVASIALTLLGLSFLLSVIWGGPLIRVLRALRIGKVIRVEGPNSHNIKMGTPTMGGIMIFVPVILLTVLFNAVSVIGLNYWVNREVKLEERLLPLLPLAIFFLYALLGAVDDWEGIRGPRRGLGMRARTKFMIQAFFAIIIAFALKYGLSVPEVFWPGYDKPISLGIWYIPFAAFIIVACSNAVNFTDGLDGLAGLIVATAFTAYGGIALIQHQEFVGNFCFTLVGAIFGFLWFNVHPAELFMGDTGSLALGATLGAVALMTGRWMVLPLIAIVPVSEVLSVVLQIGYFRLTKGRRLFKMAPLHHHFELLGWSETQVVQRFWLISLLFSMIGFALAAV